MGSVECQFVSEIQKQPSAAIAMEAINTCAPNRRGKLQAMDNSGSPGAECPAKTILVYYHRVLLLIQ